MSGILSSQMVQVRHIPLTINLISILIRPLLPALTTAIFQSPTGKRVRQEPRSGHLVAAIERGSPGKEGKGQANTEHHSRIITYPIAIDPSPYLSQYNTSIICPTEQIACRPAAKTTAMLLLLLLVYPHLVEMHRDARGLILTAGCRLLQRLPDLFAHCSVLMNAPVATGESHLAPNQRPLRHCTQPPTPSKKDPLVADELFRMGKLSDC